MIKEIKGYHVLIGLLVFFTIIIAVNAIFLTQAVRTFRGEDEPRSYIQGINYNDTLERREAQAELGWTAVSRVGAAGVRLEITDADGQGVTGLMMEARLRQQFGDSALQFERDANRIRLTLPVEAAFERNSDRPGQVLKDWLSRLQQVLAPFTQTLISVHGHTDSSGAASINQRLSERRGLAVAESLRALGIGRERLVVIGHGAARPIADDATLAGQARNRRVELWIDPLVDE